MMTDEQFIKACKKLFDYPKPIVPYYRSAPGVIDRKKTLDHLRGLGLSVPEELERAAVR